MLLQTKQQIQDFATALRESPPVQKFLAAKEAAESDTKSWLMLQRYQNQQPPTSPEAQRLAMLFECMQDQPTLLDYLDARIEVVFLLEQINQQISAALGINVAASLRPASCCG